MRRHVLVAWLLLAPSPALAVVAGEAPEFGRLDRARVADPARQAELSRSPAWRAFEAKHGAHWRVTWDDRAGTPRSIIGGRIPISTADVEKSARAFLASLRDLSGIDDARLGAPSIARRDQTIFVRFPRVTAAGTPVHGAYAELRIDERAERARSDGERGAVVLIRLETHPGADASLLPRTLDAKAASKRVEAALAPFVARAPLSSRAQPAIVPVAVARGWEYRPAFVVETRDPARRDTRWRTVIDAAHGELLARESLVPRAVSGFVRAEIEPRTVGDPLVVAPVAFAEVVVGPATATTDSAGAFTSTAQTGLASFTRFNGPWIQLESASGNDLRCSFMSGDPADCLLASLSDTELAQANAWRSTLAVRAWALERVPHLEFLNSPLDVNVNLGGECNAYFDGGSINFLLGGSSCNNTARIADVVYHEFGHWIHQENRLSGVVDGSIGEGSADYISATITNDPNLGPGFFVNGDPVREMETDLVYPDDLTGFVHADGLIWAGALWDLRKVLGAEITDRLFLKALAAGPTLDQTLDEMLLADDDDGDLSNGTPHQCEIIDALGAHGLPSRNAALSHVEVASMRLEGETTSLSVTKAMQQTALCPLPEATAARLRWRVDDGAIQTLPMSATADGFAAELPAEQGSHVVKYWFEADTGAMTLTTPPDAPETTYGFWSGPGFVVFEEDFESLPTWEHGGDGDDWEIGVPLGRAGDPIDAHSGSNVLGNDLSGDGIYEPYAYTWIESPSIDCRGCKRTHLQLRRWLNVEDATYDRARILVNDEVVWVNPYGAGTGEAKPNDSRWVFHDVDISEVADGKRFTIRFSLETDEGVEYGGWTIDDVRIVTPAEPRIEPESCACTTTESRGSYVLALAALAICLARRR